MAAGRFWFGGWLSGKSSRANFQADGERFSLSSEERAGVRSSVEPSAFRMPQGERVAWLGARCLAMTEIRCRRTETLFRYSFWDERLGQLAFEFSFAPVSMFANLLQNLIWVKKSS